MRFKLEFDCDNAAFGYGQDDSATFHETERILRKLLIELDNGNVSGRIADINGNTIGTWQFITTARPKGGRHAAQSKR